MLTFKQSLLLSPSFFPGACTCSLFLCCLGSEKTCKHQLAWLPAGGSGPKLVRKKLYRFPGLLSCFSYENRRKTKEKCQKTIRENIGKSLNTYLNSLWLHVFLTLTHLRRPARRLGRGAAASFSLVLVDSIDLCSSFRIWLVPALLTKIRKKLEITITGYWKVTGRIDF